MAITRTSERLGIGELYSRNWLRDTFEITDRTLYTGIFKPKDHDSVWIFITEDKTADRTPYRDELEGDDLFMEGQLKGRTDDLLIDHGGGGLELLVFYRKRKDEYPDYAFRYEGPFAYAGHESQGPTSFHLRRISDALVELSLANTPGQVAANLHRFNRDAPAFADRARSIFTQTTFWVYDVDEGRFGPSKFVGFKSMAFTDYETALVGRSGGIAFEGDRTRKSISELLHREFVPDRQLADQLVEWGEALLGKGIFDHVKQEKWRFVRLPSTRKYWAFFADPKIYDIESALAVLSRETWKTKRSDVRCGDRAILWRGTKDGKRGVVALAEVIGDPEVIREPQETRRFFLQEPSEEPEPRVWLRTFQPQTCPLWLDEDDSGLLASLSVARTRGGTVFHITAEQWEKLMGLLGSWPAQTGDAQQDLENLAHRTNAHGHGQGFKVSPEERKAIEGRSMRQAEQYFRDKGYDVEDVSQRQPFDLRCTKDGEDELRVEVKGTRSTGDEILLTPNEVDNARQNPERVALFVLHSIEVSQGPGGPIATGGRMKLWWPWSIDDGTLRPLGYSYEVPPE